MKLEELARKIGAKVLNFSKPLDVEINRFYAGDKISELLNRASERTLVVSNIINPHIFRVAELVDIPAICLLNDFIPEQDILNAAVEHGTVLMVSPVDMSGTVNRLFSCLGPEARVTDENSSLHDCRR